MNERADNPEEEKQSQERPQKNKEDKEDKEGGTTQPQESEEKPVAETPLQPEKPKEIRDVDIALEEAAAELAKLQESLKELSPDSPEYQDKIKQLSENIAKSLNVVSLLSKDHAQQYARYGPETADAFTPAEQRIPRPPEEKRFPEQEKDENQKDFTERVSQWHKDYRQQIYHWFDQRITLIEEQEVGLHFEQRPNLLAPLENAITRFSLPELSSTYLHLDPKKDQTEIKNYKDFSKYLEKVLDSRRMMQRLIVVWGMPERGLEGLVGGAGYLRIDHIKNFFSFTKDYPESTEDEERAEHPVVEAFKDIQRILNNNQIEKDEKLEAAIEEVFMEDIFHHKYDQIIAKSKSTHIWNRLILMQAHKKLNWQLEEAKGGTDHERITTLDSQVSTLKNLIDKGGDRLIKAGFDEEEQVKNATDEESRQHAQDELWAFRQAKKAFSILGEAGRYNLPGFSGLGDMLLARIANTDERFYAESSKTYIDLAKGIWRDFDFEYRPFLGSREFLGRIKGKPDTSQKALDALQTELKEIGFKTGDYIAKVEEAKEGEFVASIDRILTLENVDFTNKNLWQEPAEDNEPAKDRFVPGAFSAHMVKASQADKTRDSFEKEFFRDPTNPEKLIEFFEHLNYSTSRRENGRLVRRNVMELKRKELIENVLNWLKTNDAKQALEIARFTPEVARQNFLASCMKLRLLNNYDYATLLKENWGNLTIASVVRTFDIFAGALWRDPDTARFLVVNWITSSIGRVWKFITTGE